jgi:twitching motility protein PilT
MEALGDARSSGPLKELLQDPDWWVRIVVCEALGRLRSPGLIPVLQGAFADPDARWAAIEAVGRLGGAPAATALLPLLHDPEAEVRSAAVATLEQVQDPRVERALQDVTRQDASIDVRLKAVGVLRVLQGDHRQGGSLLSSKELTRPLDKMLAYAREREASDLLLTPGEPPVLRINGALERVASQKLDADVTSRLLGEVLDPVRRPILDSTGSVEFCHHVPGVGRFRTNIYTMRRGLAAAFRSIPNHAPSLDDLGLPRQLSALATYHQGIVLVTGPAGSGKSTTLTAMVDLINGTRAAHILTFEEPVEYVHAPRKALINQREIGRDSATYASAMRAGLREDPDVVVVGDLRDPETIRLALLAAETGHLVIATMQTTGAAATVDKLVDAFPAQEQIQVRGALAASLKVVVSQILVPRADGRGRVGVFEVLRSTSPVRALIREGKTVQLPSAMVIGRHAGMQTLDGALEERVRTGVITAEVALRYAPNPEQLQKALQALEAVAAASGGLRAPAALQDPQAGSSPSGVLRAPGPAASQPGLPAPFAGSSASGVRTAPGPAASQPGLSTPFAGSSPSGVLRAPGPPASQPGVPAPFAGSSASSALRAPGPPASQRGLQAPFAGSSASGVRTAPPPSAASGLRAPPPAAAAAGAAPPPSAASGLRAPPPAGVPTGPPPSRGSGALPPAPPPDRGGDKR